MTDRDWNLLWEIFEKAVDLPPEAQLAYLDEACGSNTALREKVEALIARDAHHEGVLDRSVDQSELLDDAVTRLPESIGPYHIVRELGRGGMGQVFLGERNDPEFKQQVAIKLIPLGRYSETVQRRFVLERQILSDLDHENIARLLDGGVTDEGFPYLIMEYIDGLTIDEYCDAQRLSLIARLKLFQDVCQAVHYAHRQLIVHRDIKPGNVLVDGNGKVKLLDFGVAKLLEPTLPGAAAATETIGRMATPEYASPEQLKGERLSTATDIYSLGVLLYQLLTGRRPIEVTRSDLASTIQAISSEQPTRPSQISRDLDTDNPEAYAPSPKLLQGDLDNIVMLALRKDPERRYGSAAQFAQDIQRYLDGFPVQARPESVGYRARKFIQRHTIGVVASTIIAIALVTLAVTSFLQARSLEAALAEANLEKQKATQVADFMRDLFKASDPLAPEQGKRSTESLLADGAERIRTELADQPELQASLMKTMADVYLNMSLYDEAQSLAGAARDIYADKLSTSDAASLEVELTLARIAYVQEDFDSSLSHCNSVIQALQQQSSSDSALKRKAQLQCASSLSSTGDYQESSNLARSILDDLLDQADDAQDDIARARTILGTNFWYLADYDNAREQYGIAHQIMVDQYGRGHPRSISALTQVGSVELRTGSLERSEEIHRDVLEQSKETLGQNHSQTAHAANGLGVTLLRQGRYSEAEALLIEARTVYEKLEGPDSTSAMRPMVNLALLYTETQRYEEALLTHQTLLKKEIETRGPEFWRVGLHYNNMGLVYQDLRRLEEAQNSFLQAREIIRNAWGADHPGLAYSINNLAIILHDQGRAEEAERLFQRALELRRNGLESDHPAVAATLHEFGRFLIDNGRLNEAAPMIEEALGIRREKLEPGDWRTQHTQALQGAIRAYQEDYDEAEALILPALEKLERELGPKHWRTIDARKRAHTMYTAWGRSELAQNYIPPP